MAVGQVHGHRLLCFRPAASHLGQPELKTVGIVDAYAMVKLLVAATPGTAIGIVVNTVRDAAQADLVFRQLATATKRFLGRVVTSYGFIVRDGRVGQSIVEQEPVVTRAPDAPASLCFRRLALRVASLLKPGPGPARSAGLQTTPSSEMTLEEFIHVEAPRCA